MYNCFISQWFQLETITTISGAIARVNGRVSQDCSGGLIQGPVAIAITTISGAIARVNGRVIQDCSGGLIQGPVAIAIVIAIAIAIAIISTIL